MEQTVLQCPNSQKIMEEPDFQEHSILINDEEGFKKNPYMALWYAIKVVNKDPSVNNIKKALK